MPTNRSRKQHVRSQQRPGESYTAALRRLEVADSPVDSTVDSPVSPSWEMDGQGLGSTEYSTELNGRHVVVTFAGDHKAPWLGWWELIDSEDETATTGGRFRFTSAHPDDAEVAAALAHIVDVSARLRAGKSPDLVSAEHGPEVPAGDLRDGHAYFLSWSAEEWTIGELTELGDDEEPYWRLYGDDHDENVNLTRGETSAWVDEQRRPVTIYAL